MVLELSSFRVLESVSDEGIGWGRSLSQYWIWWGLLGQRAVDGLATKSYRGDVSVFCRPASQHPSIRIILSLPPVTSGRWNTHTNRAAAMILQRADGMCRGPRRRRGLEGFSSNLSAQLAPATRPNRWAAGSRPSRSRRGSWRGPTAARDAIILDRRYCSLVLIECLLTYLMIYFVSE